MAERIWRFIEMYYAKCENNKTFDTFTMLSKSNAQNNDEFRPHTV